MHGAGGSSLARNVFCPRAAASLVFVSPTVATEAAGQLQHEPHYLTQYTLRPLTPDERTVRRRPTW